MTVYELHLGFMDAVDKLSSGVAPEIPIEQRDRYLNQGIERFIKQRYSGANSKQLPFEGDQKRTDDLSNLVVYKEILPTEEGYFSTKFSKTTLFPLPEDYWFSIVEQAKLTVTACPQYSVKITCGKPEKVKNPDQEILVIVQPKTHDQVTVLLADPFTRPSKSLCFRTMIDGDNIYGTNTKGNNFIQLFHSADSTPSKYLLGYLKKYKKLKVNTSYTTKDKAKPDHWMNLEFWFNDHTHQEIIDLAAQAALEVTENPRYQSLSNQIINSHE